MTSRETILTRRTIHRFEQREVPDQVLRRALECAVHAPNHKRTDPWKFFLPGPETRSAIIGINSELLRATKGEAAAENKARRWAEMPGWLVVTCARSSDPVRDREDLAACACAVQNFMLSLWSEGIGSKWSSGPVTRDDRFLSLLGLDQAEHDVVALVWFGWPAEASSVVRDPAAGVTVELP